MFIIKSNVTEIFEVQTQLFAAQKFFSETNNYVELMPNIESIRTDVQGIIRWNIAVEVKGIGRWQMPFTVEFLSTDEIIEWFPSPLETKNYLRFVVHLTSKTDNAIVVKISNNLEIRRSKATDLHLLAGFAGERKLSSEVDYEVRIMLNTFANRCKTALSVSN
jgi:hypothetical protein